jgi:hypothetical protein
MLNDRSADTLSYRFGLQISGFNGHIFGHGPKFTGCSIVVWAKISATIFKFIVDKICHSKLCQVAMERQHGHKFKRADRSALLWLRLSIRHGGE